MTQPAWAGMIETRYCLLAMHLLLTQPAWAGMIETSKIGVIEIAENDPARMGWDDWNNWMRPISMKQKKTQPSRVGMIETRTSNVIVCGVQDPTLAGWDDWNL